MSEERFDRIEQQLTQVIHGPSAVQQSMTVIQQNNNALREDISAIRIRIDSVEGTMLTAMRNGFNHLGGRIDDLDIDLATNEEKTDKNARKSRRLNSRLMRL